MIAIIGQINDNKCNVHISSDSDDFDLTQELYSILRTVSNTYPEEYCEAIEMHQRFLEREENNAKNDTSN